MKKGHRFTHCRRGHAFDEANTRIQAGQRVCRRCIADRAAKRYHDLGLKDKRNKPRDREVWRASYKRDPQKHRDRNTKERAALSDAYVLTLIADQHKELRAASKGTPLVNAYRAQLQLKRLIHERSK